MRRLHGGLLFVCLAAFLAVNQQPAVFAQKGNYTDGIRPEYWALRSIGIPLKADDIKKWYADRNRPEPTHAQLLFAINRGNFQRGPKLALNTLDELDGGKKGFRFTADKDGEYEFATQLIFADGTTSPRNDDIRPEKRFIIDSTAPVVKIRGTANIVDWSVTDENLDTNGIKLQCKFPTWKDWETIDRRTMKAIDRYGWELRQGQVLEVRVVAKDRAGNEGVSPVVRLPADGAGSSEFPRPQPGSGPEWASTPPGGAGGGGGANLPRARTVYVNSLNFDVDYTVHRMGRSGVKKAHLWILKEQGTWASANTVDVNLMPNGKDQTLAIPHTVDREGTYGFYVVPESGAGFKGTLPQRDDPPQVYVVVDTAKPAVQITSVTPRNGARGPIVEITWKAADQNLMPNSINLEYSIDKNAKDWKEIKYKLSNLPNSDNTGRYEWEIPDPELWRFFVRIRATDWASNTGEHVWDKEVMVDLDPPAAGISGVRSSGVPMTKPNPTSDTPLPKSKGKTTGPLSESLPSSSKNPPNDPILPSGSGTPPPKPPGSL